MNKNILIHVVVEAGALAALAALQAVGAMDWSALGMYAPLVVSAVSIATSAAHKYLDPLTKPAS